MAIDDEAEEAFRKGFVAINKMPATATRNKLLERIIEAAMKMRGVKSATIKED